MKRYGTWLGLTIVFYLFFLIWNTPADFALSLLKKFEIIRPGPYSVTGTEGDWTDGRILELEFDGIKVKNFTWRFKPVGLLTGRLKFGLKGNIEDGSIDGTLKIGLDTFELNEVNGRIPAGILEQAYLPGIDLTGVFEAAGLSLSAKDGYLIDASGRLAWNNARVESPYRMGLGGIVANLSTDSGGIVIKLDDTGGPLQASGLGILSPDGGYSFDGSFGSRQGAASELATYLQIMGKPQPDGMVKVELKGRIARLF